MLSTILWTIGCVIVVWFVLTAMYGSYLANHPEKNPAAKVIDAGHARDLAEKAAREKYGTIFAEVDKSVLAELLGDAVSKEPRTKDVSE